MKQINARFVLHPITGVENSALYVPGANLLFDTDDIWWAYRGELSYLQFMDLYPAAAATIALELFEAGSIEEIK